MIKLDNVSKYYYSSNTVVPALRKIKLEFDIGEFVAITGESGSGKSTLLNIISGIDTYDDGELYVHEEATSHFGDDDWEEYRKNKIGFVFQNYNLVENYSALNNVESSLLIQGYENKEAKKIAKELLNKVGLKAQMHQLTSKLSSGQKQRLSIARALAKNTDIIVADEPTGNLDSENSKQIMELFAQLAKDKLIIVVTHNYEETAPYVTRKIRLHDGEIVDDIQVKPNSKDVAEGLNKTPPKAIQVTQKTPGKIYMNKLKSDAKIAWRFTRMNIVTQPRRVLLFMLFLLITARASFTFFGDFYSLMDDVFTKDYNDKVFMNGNDTRIVVKREDGSNITDEDINRFNQVKYVEMADQYDYVNDINYYIDDGTDYEYLYQPNENLDKIARLKMVSFLKTDRFMRSSTCVIESDLSAGRLPTARNEIVFYSDDPTVLDSEKTCYFTAQNTWGYDNYYSTKVKVVGILKKETDQVYFSRELCSMLSLSLYENSYNISLGKNPLSGEYNVGLSFIPVIGEGLEYNQCKVSIDLAASSVYSLPGSAEITIYTGVDKEKAPITNQAEVVPDFNSHSVKFVEVNDTWFHENYKDQSNQASVYIKDYVNTDYVLKKLNSMGYQAISALRISSVEYNSWKVSQRNSQMEKDALILLILGLLEILIIGAFLRIKYKNYIILGSIGMNHRTIQLMNHLEMMIYTIASMVIIICLAQTIPLVHFNNLKYFNGKTYLVYIVFNIFTMVITVLLFNVFLKRKQRIE